jgi:hypothetical protein
MIERTLIGYLAACDLRSITPTVPIRPAIGEREDIETHLIPRVMAGALDLNRVDCISVMAEYRKTT